MSYRHDRRRKYIIKIAPWSYGRIDWMRASTQGTILVGRDVRIAAHPLAGLKLRAPGTAAVLRKLRGQAILGVERETKPMTVDEAAEKIATEYGDVLAELEKM